MFDLAWFLVGQNKTGVRNRSETDRATDPIKEGKAEGNVAWCVLQLVGSSLSSQKVHVSQTSDTTAQRQSQEERN